MSWAGAKAVGLVHAGTSDNTVYLLTCRPELKCPEHIWQVHSVAISAQNQGQGHWLISLSSGHVSYCPPLAFKHYMYAVMRPCCL